jgi:hypothetical protein
MNFKSVLGMMLVSQPCTQITKPMLDFVIFQRPIHHQSDACSLAHGQSSVSTSDTVTRENICSWLFLQFHKNSLKNLILPSINSIKFIFCASYFCGKITASKNVQGYSNEFTQSEFSQLNASPIEYRSFNNEKGKGLDSCRACYRQRIVR